MRIFIAVRHANDPRQFYGGLWSGNFYPALRELGCELVESQVDLLPASRFMQTAGDFSAEELEIRARITQGILDEVEQAHRQKPIDLFLSYFYNSHFDPAAFARIHHLGIPTVNFYCNSMYQFELVAQIAPKVNFAWHAEKPAAKLYKAVGANPVWVQMAADPKVYYPVPGLTRQPKACFVGQRYADRDRWMAALLRAEVPVDIYGPNWARTPLPPAVEATPVNSSDKHAVASGSLASYRQQVLRNLRLQGPIGGAIRTLRQIAYRRQTRKLEPLFAPYAKGGIPFTQIAPTFSAYEVVLNFSNVWADGRPGSPLIPHVRLRDFEAPMCKTCYITGFTEELTEFYEPGKEVDTYTTSSELVDKVRYYLNHPDAAQKLRQAGYQRALRDHTWKNRFMELFGKIGVAR